MISSIGLSGDICNKSRVNRYWIGFLSVKSKPIYNKITAQNADNSYLISLINCPDSKVHMANMGPTWVLSAPGRPHVGHMNLAVKIVKAFSVWGVSTGDRRLPSQSTSNVEDVSMFWRRHDKSWLHCKISLAGYFLDCCQPKHQSLRHPLGTLTSFYPCS